VILLSAGRPPENERNEAWRFLAKPVDLDVLERAVIEALDIARLAGTNDGFAAAPADDVAPVSLIREDMLGWVSHEIKTPLTAAVSLNQLALRDLRRGADAVVTERRLAQLSRQLQRMDELVNSLLDAAQLQEGQLAIETARNDLVDIVRTVVNFWKETHPEIDFDLDISTATAEVEGDRERLRQIIDNFVSNAIKYGQGSESRIGIWLALRTDASHVTVSVTDRGRGIPAHEIHQIFNRFHRVAGQGGRGHGLGLYIAAALARLHGGTVAVDSQVGRGSTFVLTLPLVDAIRIPEH
jgi:two-component system sensor histidine kinase/response regulator